MMAHRDEFAITHVNHFFMPVGVDNDTRIMDTRGVLNLEYFAGDHVLECREAIRNLDPDIPAEASASTST